MEQLLDRLFDGRGRKFVRERFIQPISEFVNTEASGGIFLLVATAVALLWANSPWDYRYFDLIHAHLAIDLGIFSIDNSLGHLVNDGLMTVFFFVVGLEIKRELIHGELASRRKAALPVAAAIGGMVVPALIYVAWNAGSDGAKGWGIPMATDIAFAMGVLALLGRRAPFSLKVFLLALAIVDDLGAILVIAVFYTDSISLEALFWAGFMLVVIIAAARARRPQHRCLRRARHALLGRGLQERDPRHAGRGGARHADPGARRASPSATSKASALDLLVSYRHARDRGETEQAQQVLEEFESLSRGTESPLDRLEHTLHPWVSYLIVPVFALVNAGVVISSGLISDSVSSPISLGIASGLVIGKPLGILVACFIAVRLGIADLPRNTNYGHILGLGLIAGIGFTVSLFITGLAFDQRPVHRRGEARHSRGLGCRRGHRLRVPLDRARRTGTRQRAGNRPRCGKVGELDPGGD